MGTASGRASAFELEGGPQAGRRREKEAGCWGRERREEVAQLGEEEAFGKEARGGAPGWTVGKVLAVGRRRAEWGCWGRWGAVEGGSATRWLGGGDQVAVTRWR